jgi:hypothetical protein
MAATLLAALAVLGTAMASAAPAHATDPNNPANDRWYAADQYAQVYGGPAMVSFQGHVITVGRGTDNALWYQVDNEHFITIPNARTIASPTLTVVGSGANAQVILFHTGIDGNYYYTPLVLGSSDPSNWYFRDSWNRVPLLRTGGYQTLQPYSRPAVVGTPDGRIYAAGAYPNGTMALFEQLNGRWSEWFIPGDGITFGGLAIVYDQFNGVTIWHRGTTSPNNLYYIRFDTDSNSFINYYWQQDPGGGRTVDDPAAIIYRLPNGAREMVIAVRGDDGRVWTEVLTPDARYIERDWQPLPPDAAGQNLVTNTDVALSLTGDGHVRVDTALSTSQWLYQAVTGLVYLFAPLAVAYIVMRNASVAPK